MRRELKASYDWCQRAARRAGSNFYWSFHILPNSQRRAMYALYSFARHVDDIADDQSLININSLRTGSEPDREGAASWIYSWRNHLSAALQGEYRHPLLPALIDTVDKFQIPVPLLFEILDGVELDLHHQPPENLAEWIQYCDRVASAVGLACVHIWGFSDVAVFEPARRCGWAFQLTNILRDLAEDADRGRLYLPLDDLREHGCVPEDLLQKRESPQVQNLLRAQIARARQWYAEAVATRQYLNGRGKCAFDLMFARYRAILERFAHEPLRAFGPRIGLSAWIKLRVATRALLQSATAPPDSARCRPAPIPATPRCTVAVIGGGLAGIAAAEQLASQGCAVTLFEARRSLGGRAGSFVDPETGEMIDHCQHVGMGCCRQLLQFLAATDVLRYFGAIVSCTSWAPTETDTNLPQRAVYRPHGTWRVRCGEPVTFQCETAGNCCSI